MRAHEIIRSVLELLDKIDTKSDETVVEPVETSDPEELARMKQIAGLIDRTEPILTNRPKEAVADIDAVLASGTDVNKSKHPADIRTNAPSMYPAAQWRSE